jgi:hypothetical protein
VDASLGIAHELLTQLTRVGVIDTIQDIDGHRFAIAASRRLGVQRFSAVLRMPWRRLSSALPPGPGVWKSAAVPEVLQGPADLAALERCLESLPVRVAQRLWTALAGRPRRIRRWTGSDVAAAVNGASPSPEQLVRAVRGAIDAGAIDTAGSLLEQLRRQPGSLGSVRGPVVHAFELELHLALGDRDQALAKARARRFELSASAQGVAMLELLGIPGGVVLPGGRPNLLGLSRRIASGELNAFELVSSLDGKGSWWLRMPELSLLFFSALWATEPQRAVGFLNGFLRRYGCAELSVHEQASNNVLARLRGPVARRVTGGPLVSVVVAAHNCASTLVYAVDSLLGQSYQSLEILIGDDCSEDDTWGAMQSLKNDPRVRLFRSSTRQGAYNVRNALAARARGDLLTFHDADDLALGTRIERQVECLERKRSLACAASLLRVRPSGHVVFFKNQRAIRLSRVSLLLRRQTFIDIGPFRSTWFGADEELHEQLRARFGPRAVARIAAPLMLSLWSSASATRHQGSESLEDGYRALPRRTYSELVFRKCTLGQPISEAMLDAQLRETGNYAEPSELIEIS